MKLRTYVLIALSAIVLGIFGKILISPNQRSLAVQPYTLPEIIPLQGWEFEGSQTLESQDVNSLGDFVGREYRYIRDEVKLNIQARYIVDTDGDVQKFISQYMLPADSSRIDFNQFETHILQDIGTYARFIEGDTAYLTACINPYGGSTVTDREFKFNRNFYDIRHRLLPWVFGDVLKDERCLWTYLSMNITSEALTIIHQNLEETWLIWYGHWYKAFPSR